MVLLMNNKEDIVRVLKKLVKYQYYYEQESLEIGGKIVKGDKALANIYKTLIDKEVENIENRGNSIA